MEPVLQLLDLEVDLRVGEILLTQPFVEVGNRARQAPAPFAIRFEAGHQIARSESYRSLYHG